MKHLFTLILLCISFTFSAQTDEQAVETIFKNSLTNGMSYQWLDHLSNQIGGRLSGSLNAERAVEYTKEELFAKYSNTLFTKGDFFCNIKEFKTLETIK